MQHGGLEASHVNNIARAPQARCTESQGHDRKAGGNQEGSRTQESGGQGQTGSQDHKEGGDAEGRLETDDALNIRLETR